MANGIVALSGNYQRHTGGFYRCYFFFCCPSNVLRWPMWDVTERIPTLTTRQIRIKEGEIYLGWNQFNLLNRTLTWLVFLLFRQLSRDIKILAAWQFFSEGSSDMLQVCHFNNWPRNDVSAVRRFYGRLVAVKTVKQVTALFLCLNKRKRSLTEWRQNEDFSPWTLTVRKHFLFALQLSVLWFWTYSFVQGCHHHELHQLFDQFLLRLCGLLLPWLLVTQTQRRLGQSCERRYGMVVS